MAVVEGNCYSPSLGKRMFLDNAVVMLSVKDLHAGGTQRYVGILLLQTAHI